MALQIPTEQLQEKILDFLENELGNAWTDLPEEQRNLVARVAINYGKENVKLLIAKLFKGIDVDETKANIDQIKTQLLALGVALQAQVIQALDKAIMNAIQAFMADFATGSLPSNS